MAAVRCLRQCFGTLCWGAENKIKLKNQFLKALKAGLDMESNNTATVDKSMLLSEEEDSLSVQSDMMDADSLHEQDYSCQDTELQMDLEQLSDCMLPLRRFMHADDLACSEERLNKSLLSESLIPVRASQKSIKPKSRGPYRRYTAHQVERLFYLVIEEGLTAKAAALETGINWYQHSDSSTLCQKI